MLLEGGNTHGEDKARFGAGGVVVARYMSLLSIRCQMSVEGKNYLCAPSGAIPQTLYLPDVRGESKSSSQL